MFDGWEIKIETRHSLKGNAKRNTGNAHNPRHHRHHQSQTETEIETEWTR